MGKLLVIKCKKCKEEFATRKDINAEKSHDRPQCSYCKERVGQ